MRFKIKYKRKWFWKTVEVTGHQISPEHNRIDLFLPDGSILSLAPADQIDIRLGKDWVEAQKKEMEKQAGQPVIINQEG